MQAGFSILCRMPRLLGTALRWFLIPFLALLAWSMAVSFLRSAGEALGARSLLWCGAGFLFRAASHLLWRRLGRDDPFGFIDTLEHELTHALMGYLTLCPPVSLSATLKAGGEVELKGANPLAVLAPYFLPLWGLLAALLGIAVKSGLQGALSNGLLFLLGSFAWRLCLEYRWRQTDLHAYGFVFSTFVVAILLLLMLGLLLWMRGALGWAWLPAAGRRVWEELLGLRSWMRGNGASGTP
jgi:hypothetical protein